MKLIDGSVGVFEQGVLINDALEVPILFSIFFLNWITHVPRHIACEDGEGSISTSRMACLAEVVYETHRGKGRGFRAWCTSPWCSWDPDLFLDFLFDLYSYCPYALVLQRRWIQLMYEGGWGGSLSTCDWGACQLERCIGEPWPHISMYLRSHASTFQKQDIHMLTVLMPTCLPNMVSSTYLWTGFHTIFMVFFAFNRSIAR